MNQNRRRKQFVCELGCSGKDNSICGRFLLAEYAKSTNGHSMTQPKNFTPKAFVREFSVLETGSCGINQMPTQTFHARFRRTKVHICLIMR